MALSEKATAILSSILSFGTSEDSFALRDLRCQSPGSSALYAFCELLAAEPREEDLQVFLSQHPGFLMGLFGTKDGGDLAFIAKPRMGEKFVADFGLLQVFQGGATITLVEIESSHEAVFTANLGPAKRLQSALTQIDEWREYIEPNKTTFVRSMLDQVDRLPELDQASPNPKGWRTGTSEQIRGLWGAFAGNEYPNIRYAIIVGRWSQLAREQKQRFISKFSGEENCFVYTFEQLARQAVYRTSREEF